MAATSDDAPLATTDVLEARARISAFTELTPVHTSRTLDALAGDRSLHFKCENFQRTGAFKFRGACNAVFKAFGAPQDPSEDSTDISGGVVTHSSGNHGQALALAARLRGIPCTVVVPRTAPPVKRRAVEGYGARVVSCEPTQRDREATAAAVVRDTGALFVHPYDNPVVMAGQGTLALELLEQVPDLDAIVVPVGGGGMLSGVCVAAHSVNPRLRIFAAEPAAADDCFRSMAAGERVENEQPPQTIADGLKTNLGLNGWPIIKTHVERVFTVSDDEIRAAMRLVWERMKLCIEPSAGVGVAVVLSPAFRKLEGLNKVGVVLCGGNVDLDSWKWD
jgi:threonine dehydratase